MQIVDILLIGFITGLFLFTVIDFIVNGPEITPMVNPIEPKILPYPEEDPK